MPSCCARTRHGAGRRFGRVLEEGAEKPDGAELYREAKAHVVTTAPADQLAVGVIQMEEASELFR